MENQAKYYNHGKSPNNKIERFQIFTKKFEKAYDKIEKIENSVINKLIVTDTVDIPDEKKIAKIEVVTVANVFAEAIQRVYKGTSVSELFEF